MSRNGEPVSRRTVLQSGSVLASLATFGQAVTGVAAADGHEDVGDDGVPPEARTVEAGLESFAAKWDALGGYITQTKFGRYVSGTTINCVVAGDPRAYAVELGPAGGAAVSAGRDPRAHATLTLNEDDFLGVLYGEFSPYAPATQGNAYVQKSDVNYASLFGLVLYLFAHLPASLSHDPGFNAENMLGGFYRQAGFAVDCGGGPSGTEFDPEPPSREGYEGTTVAPEVTSEVAQRVDRTSYEDLPQAVVAATKEQLKSILGVSYAATLREPGRKFVDAVEAMSGGGPGEATAIAGDRTFQTSAAQAGMVNAYLAQMLEWEDFTWYAHTGSATVPTALAAAEAAGASGKELLTAIALGNEIAGRVGQFASDPTSLGQALPVHQAECPFVAGKLLLDSGPGDLQSAAGIAALQPERTAVGGWPSEAKGFVAASPVRGALEAAQFAGAGLDGRKDLLENPGGLFYNLTDVAHPQDMALAYRGLGEEWLMVDQFYNKRYATNGFFQAAVHAALQVRESLPDEFFVDGAARGRLDPDAVEEIEVHMNVAMAGTGTIFSGGDAQLLTDVDSDLNDYTYTALLFEAYYAIAAALLEGDLTHRQYRPDLVSDAAIENLWKKTEGGVDLSVGDFGGKVVVRTATDELTEVTNTLDESRHAATVECIRTEVNGVDDDSFDLGRDKLERSAADVIGDRWKTIDAEVDRIEEYDDVSRFARKL